MTDLDAGSSGDWVQVLTILDLVSERNGMGIDQITY